MYASTWLYLILINSIKLYHGSTWLYLTLLHSTIALDSSTWLYSLHSTMEIKKNKNNNNNNNKIKKKKEKNLKKKFPHKMVDRAFLDSTWLT